MSKLKIAYLSASDPRDKKVWSGTHYSIFRTLNKFVGETTPIGPCKPEPETLLGKLITGISQQIFKKRYNYRHSRLLGKAYSRFFQKQLKKSNYDLIVAPAALCELSYLETTIPIVYIADNTIDLSVNYHKSLTNLFPFSEKETRNLERKVLEKSSAIIVSSEWASSSLLKHYKLPKEKVFTIPFGANMENLPEMEDAIQEKKRSGCKLLFVGVYWDNKGGDIAYNCLLELHNINFDASLTVVGCSPPAHLQHSKMNIIPFIDKNSPEGRKKLTELFLDHDILILPTRFDCTPIVICEAAAFAMPCLVANTGGVAGHLIEGRNGFLIDYNDSGKAYADKVVEIFSDEATFKQLRISSRNTYDELLNWDNYGKKVKEIVSLILENE